MVRIAAVGDLHMRAAVRGRFRRAFTRLTDHADVLLLAGDLTNGGTFVEGNWLCDELAGLPVPVIAVLGNHDHDEGHGNQITAMLRGAGIHVLDGTGVIIDLAGTRVGVAGLMGGGGGFPSSDGPDEDLLEDRRSSQLHDLALRRTADDARRLGSALASLDCELRIALTHFAPVRDTLVGEPPEIYPALGCHLLADAIDDATAHLAVHGHAHLGREHGRTTRGTPVRNVAHPVLRRPYATYHLSAATGMLAEVTVP